MTAPGAYRIRPAMSADRAAVARELAAYLRFMELDPDPDGLDHDVAAWEREYDGASGVLLVGEDAAGSVIGTAGVRLLAPGTGELKRMWLRPEYRGLGLGRRLMEACLAAARGLGCRVLRLDSRGRLEPA